MKRLLSAKFVLTTLLLTSALSGCQTMNSQAIDLHPEISVSRQLPSDTRIEIKTADLRSSKIVGMRLTGEEPQPKITLKDSNHLLHHVAEHALEDMGIRRFYQGEFTLEVSLIDLNYKATKKTLKQTVAVDMKARVKVSKGDKSYTGTYATEKKHTYLKTPTEHENETLINAVVSDTMNRAFNDPQLLDFIQFN